MIKKVLRVLAVAVICLSGYMLLSAPTATSQVTHSEPTAVTKVVTPPEPPVTKDSTGSASVNQPNVVEQFGPPGVILSTLLGGILLIIKAVNEGKQIDVVGYKARTEEAESRANTEIAKVHKKLEEMDAKLNSVIADRDEFREQLEDRKAHFTEKFLTQEKRHQIELEETYTALNVEVHTRHVLERLLVENGIAIPDTPPPYTRKMKSEVTEEDVKEVQEALGHTSEIPIVNQ